MHRRIAITCVLLGFICLFCSLGFVVYNYWEEENATKSTDTLLEDAQNMINEQNATQDELQIKMPTINVDGYDCIGILTIPVLDLELPVLTDWSYAKLKKAPCHYYGTYYEKDFVIAAHNYKSHFGRLSELQVGDIVIFTDVNGLAHCYETALTETLPKEATKEMIASGFDLSLYTCTPGGASRVTVRCNAVKDSN
jgi:sortase A